MGRSSRLALGLTLLLCGCSKVVSDDDVQSAYKSTDELAAVFEAAMTAIVAVADEIEGENFGEAGPACAARAGDQACQSGTRAYQYANCVLNQAGDQLAGESRLEYSNPSCSLEAPGASAVRAAALTRQSRAGLIRVSTAPELDYQRRVTGGGAKVTRASSGAFELDVLGLHKSLEGRYALSIRSLTPTTISTAAGLLERNGRVLRGGNIEVAHNAARYTATLALGDLGYQASCCYPTSGRVDIRYTGTVSGTGSVNFTGCGSAVFTALGRQTELQFRSCD
ncbi:MAG TPA: hypothetical protein VFV50_08495 [Bdellovibrionales bacterium]|nr:hypothetical protein [Bdellovibrionales bacterium]